MLYSKIVKTSALTASDRTQMYGLLAQHFAAVNKENFSADLEEKDYCLCLYTESGELAGFTTLKIIAFEMAGQRCGALFSGDTIIHRSYWGDQTLPNAWCEFAGNIKTQYSFHKLYWFLIVKGHRTYRYLPLFTHRFYPNCKTDTPEPLQQLMDKLANEKFGKFYNKEQGLIRFEESKGHLKDNLTSIPLRLQQDAHVEYFLKRNPNYFTGDELVCLTELSVENMRSRAKRAFLRGLRKSADCCPNMEAC